MTSWQSRHINACPRGVALATGIYAERAQGSEIFDIDNRRYIDFAGGIGVLNVGHRHPRIEAAVAEQLQRFTHTCFQVVPYPEYIRLAEQLNAVSPGTFAKKTAFFTTGAEAVENAIKIARSATGRRAVIAFSGAFHGRTMMGLALTGKTVPYKLGFGPFPGDVYRAPFPSGNVSSESALGALEQLFRTDIPADQVCAIIVEPVQGEGGFYPAPAAFVTGLRRLCDQHGILLIADEIQSGFGRTGKLFAMEHFDVAADMTTVAKSMAGGMPLSAVVGRAEVMDAVVPGGLGSTYAGAPLALAAALAVIDVIREEGLLERGVRLGERLRTRLETACAGSPGMAEIRGLGAMIAIEFRAADGSPSPALANAVRLHALENGLILLACGMFGNVIRFLFPLNTPDAVFDEGLDILVEALYCSQNRQAIAA